MNANETLLTMAQIKSDIMKALPFMLTMSQSRPIRNILLKRGYTRAEHHHGWRMLFQLMCHQHPWSEHLVEAPSPQHEALAELDRWDNQNFRFARAALEHHYPDQAAYVFKELEIQYGPQSMPAIRTFLERVRTLREGLDPYREAHREADLAAVLLLEARNIVGPEIEQRLNRLIALSLELPSEPEEEEHDPRAMDEAAYQELARAFRAWLRDWRNTARAAIGNRRYLISLGLSKSRKKPKAGLKTASGGGPSAPEVAPGGVTACPLCRGNNTRVDGS